MGAVPAGIACRGTREALAGRAPIARIERTGVAAVTVVGGGDVADEIVAVDDIGVEIDVRTIAGVDHGHDLARAQKAQIPGLIGIAAAHAALEAVLQVEEGVVGGERRIQTDVRFDVFDIGIDRDLAHQGFGVDAVQGAVGHYQLRTDAEGALALERERLGPPEYLGCGLVQRALLVEGAGFAGAPLAVGDDETIDGLVVAQTGDVHAVARECGTRQHERGQCDDKRPTAQRGIVGRHSEISIFHSMRCRFTA